MERDHQIKIVKLLSICLAISFIVYLLYPESSKQLVKMRSYTAPFGYKMYSYQKPKDLISKDLSSSSPAISVPILMYHGVVTHGDVGPNTERSRFVEHMEMLSREGYTTISVKEFDEFRAGKFKLPPKPIIITFDDGRRDSYYTVDEVFKGLGFKATLFLATVKANTEDTFYLDWEELKTMRDSGRWEIEAHGRNSHEKIIIDDKGTEGRFYTSRIYNESGLESIEDYLKRIEEDYVRGVKDIEDNLGITPVYFAVPLSDYGVQEPSNFPDAFKYNKQLTRKYFRISFSQATDYDSFYNYKDVNPYDVLRLEVKNISEEELLKKLEVFSDKPVKFTFPNRDAVLEENQVQLLYGKMSLEKGISLKNIEGSPSVRLVIGSRGWRNYSVDAVVETSSGKSTSLILYYKDEENFISVNRSGSSYTLLERFNGVEKELAFESIPTTGKAINLKARILNNTVTVTVNDAVLADAVAIRSTRGALGLSVWDPKGEAEATITKLIARKI